MKKISSLIAMLVAVFTFSQAQNTTALEQDPLMVKYAETITVEDLKDNLTILASDALEGRETGKRGQKMAAAFIKAHFESLGLEGPVNTENTSNYYQNVLLSVSEPGNIYVKYNNTKLTNIDDFIYYGSGYTSDEISTKLVFAGAGTEKDFESLDIEGKSVLINTTERNVRQSALKIVQEKGGKMLFVVYADDDEGYNEYHKRWSGYIGRAKLGLDNGENPEEAGIIFISPSTAAAIFDKSFEKMQKAITNASEGKKNALKKIKPVEISYKISYDTTKIISENVLGFLEGTDLKDEVLVITSHYDHLGKHDGKIYNGADDDGSGTVAVMDIAEAFAKAKADGNGPRRSILFMTVTGEEKGLLGSEYYAENPIFPLENTVADLNIDMIGRIDDRELKSTNYVSLVGADKLSSELHAISENMNNTYTNLFLDYTYNDENHPERIYYRSDHWNFAKNGIPVIFYTTGSHPDYHKETDTVDRIEFELMRTRTQLVFYTAWEIANRDVRLIIDVVKDDKAEVGKK